MALRAVVNIFSIAELRGRLVYTLGLMGIYRLGIFISTPGVNRMALAENMRQMAGSQAGMAGLLNMFTGGALGQASIFGLGIMPYVSASIIMQLLTVVVPSLERLQKEGGGGRQKINQFTRYATIVLSLVQGFFITRYLAQFGSESGAEQGRYLKVVDDPSLWFTFMTIVTLVSGTAFIMWLGERITERGIGNGISIIIFSGIASAIIPGGQELWLLSKGNLELGLIVALLGFMVFAIAAVVFVERGMRRIPIQYAKRMAGRQMFSGQETYFPMKVNTAGVIPPIFAMALLSFPSLIARTFPAMGSLDKILGYDIWVRDAWLILFIVFFSFFYTSLTFRADDVADNIKKQGGYIPGIRPGQQTAEFIERVLNRITVGGAIYLAVISVLPSVVSSIFNVSFPFGGTALLIVVGVALDTVQQIEGHLISRNYEGFAGPRGPKIRGRIRAAA